MTTLMPTKTKFTDFNVKYNDIKIDDLFRKYEDIGFIYPEKKALLKPHFKQIRSNWENLLRSEEEYLWILNDENSRKGNFASICAWKYSNYGLQAQHLVSSGNPFLSLRVMLAAQFKAEHHHDATEVRSSQNWFRPNNRYAFRVFASMYEKLGPEKSALTLFQFLQLNLSEISSYQAPEFEVEEVTEIDEELIAFVEKRYGQVFVRAEELDQADITLAKMGEAFQKYQLDRSRRVLKIKDSYTQEVLACIIANRAPLGINFSFLENRAYYIVDRDIEESKRANLLNTMNAAIKPFYQDLALQAIPIVTDTLSSSSLQSQGAVWLREYMQSIWMREGFSQWYAHINSFLQKIESRIRKDVEPGPARY